MRIYILNPQFLLSVLIARSSVAYFFHVGHFSIFKMMFTSLCMIVCIAESYFSTSANYTVLSIDFSPHIIDVQ